MKMVLINLKINNHYTKFILSCAVQFQILGCYRELQFLTFLF